jgi:hypothetical protein
MCSRRFDLAPTHPIAFDNNKSYIQFPLLGKQELGTHSSVSRILELLRQ